MRRQVTTTYPEMIDRKASQPARAITTPFDLVRAEIPCPELNRFLYTAVGADWVWYSRLPWDYAQWLAYLDRPELETWVAYVSGTPAGYLEVERTHVTPAGVGKLLESRPQLIVTPPVIRNDDGEWQWDE